MNRVLQENLLEAHRAIARRSFKQYCIQNGQEQPVPIAPHQDLLINELQGVAETIMSGKAEKVRLMFFLPPGHAKSTYASVLFPAWFIGNFPVETIILSSYSTDLSHRFGRKVRDQVGASAYPFNISLSENTKSKGEWETNKGGEFFASGVGSGITGRRAKVGIIDDPIKGRQDADSETIRNSTWEWYLGDFRTRLKPNNAIILIQTRWHEDDLAGRILPERYDFSSGLVTSRDGKEVWKVINLPAIAEQNDYMKRKPGTALWPNYITLEHLRDEESIQGLRNWASLYQQRPAPETGSFFKKEHIVRYELSKHPKLISMYGSTDFAVTSKGGDFTELGVGGIDFLDNLWIVDWWSGQESADVWIDQMLDLSKKWNAIEWQCEKGVIEKSLQPFIDKRMEERGIDVYLALYARVADKATLAQAIRARMAQRKVMIPNGDWGDRLVAQLLAFPSGTFDDMVDVMAGFGLRLNRLEQPEVVIPIDPKDDYDPKLAKEDWDKKDIHGDKPGEHDVRKWWNNDS